MECGPFFWKKKDAESGVLVSKKEFTFLKEEEGQSGIASNSSLTVKESGTRFGFSGRTQVDTVVTITLTRSIVSDGTYHVSNSGSATYDPSQTQNASRRGAVNPSALTTDISSLLGAQKHLRSATNAIKKFVNETPVINQLASIDKNLAEVEGAAAEVQDQSTDSENPTAVSSGEECTDGQNPEGLPCKVQYASAKEVADQANKEATRSINRLETADEFSEVLMAVIKATTVGLMKRKLEKGIGADVVSKGVTQLRQIRGEIAREVAGPVWWGTLFGSPNDPNRFVLAYQQLVEAELVLEDGYDLMEFVRFAIPYDAIVTSDEPSRAITQGRSFYSFFEDNENYSKYKPGTVVNKNNLMTKPKDVAVSIWLASFYDDNFFYNQKLLPRAGGLDAIAAFAGIAGGSGLLTAGAIAVQSFAYQAAAAALVSAGATGTAATAAAAASVGGVIAVGTLGVGIVAIGAAIVIYKAFSNCLKPDGVCTDLNYFLTPEKTKGLLDDLGLTEFGNDARENSSNPLADTLESRLLEMAKFPYGATFSRGEPRTISQRLSAATRGALKVVTENPTGGSSLCGRSVVFSCAPGSDHFLSLTAYTSEKLDDGVVSSCDAIISPDSIDSVPKDFVQIDAVIPEGKETATIVLSWKPVLGATAYELQRYVGGNCSGEFSTLPEVENVVYEDYNLPPDSQFSYRVRAVNTISKLKQESRFSDCLSAATDSNSDTINADPNRSAVYYQWICKARTGSSCEKCSTVPMATTSGARGSSETRLGGVVGYVMNLPFLIHHKKASGDWSRGRLHYPQHAYNLKDSLFSYLSIAHLSSYELNRMAKGAKEQKKRKETLAVNIHSLLEVYETTVAALVDLVGKQEEYDNEARIPTSRHKQAYRDSIFVNEGVDPTFAWERVRDETTKNFRDGLTPVFVNFDSQNRVLMEYYVGICVGNLPLYPDNPLQGVLGEYTYRQTNCTLRQFYATVFREALPILPNQSGLRELVRFVYAMGNRTGFIWLPDESLQDTWSNFSGKPTDPPADSSAGTYAEDIQNYDGFKPDPRLLGRVLLGEQHKDFSTTNFGKYTSFEAVRVHKDSFEDKFINHFNERFNQFYQDIL